MALLSRSKKKHEPAVAAAGMSQDELNTFQRILYRQSGIVLKDSKRALVEGRVTQRLRALGMPSYGQYLEFLAQDASGGELVHLIDAISTNITRFYREADHFDFVAAKVREWAESGVRRMRFWSAACSTGEEPYSLAMSLHAPMREHGLDLRILATDISTRVLARAADGVYGGAQLEAVDPELRRRHFAPAGGGDSWRISDEIKAMVLFRRLNFTVFPYPIKGVFDVIFCRNAMIYFDRPLRSRMIPEFARLLRPGGYLLIGHAETLIGVESGFRTCRPSYYERSDEGEAS